MRTFRHRPFAAFWIAGFASNTGTWLQFVLSTIVVYAWTGSAAALGILGAASFLPLLLFTLPAGVVSDRWDRRRIVVVTHLAALAASLALAAAVHAGIRSVEAVGIGAFLMYTCYALSKPALSSVFPALVPKEEIPQATALNSLSFVLGQLAGPLVAAWCMAIGAPALGFALNGLSYLGLTIVVLRLRFPARAGTGVAGSVVDQLRGAGRYIRSDRRVSMMLVVVAVSVPILDVVRMLAPVLTAGAGDPDEGSAALVAAALGAGAAVGLVLSTRLYDLLGPVRVLPVSLVGIGVAAVGVAAAGTLTMLLAASLVLGVAYGVVFASATAAIQAAVPDALRGRVMSVHTLVHLGTRPFLLPIAGAIAAVAGVAGAIVAFVMILPLGIVASVAAGREESAVGATEQATTTGRG